jgi:hypothetical protein
MAEHGYLQFNHTNVKDFWEIKAGQIRQVAVTTVQRAQDELTTRDPQHYESFELADHTIGSMLAYKGFMSRFGQHQPRGRVQSLCHVCPGRDGSWPLQCGARRWWHYIGPGSPVLFGPG